MTPLTPAAVEFIHTATLLHDDVVDISSLRRGRPTANAEFGNAPSVLVGDFLLGQAFRLMVGVGSLPALDVLSTAAVTIAEGEVLQLTAAQDLATTEAIYLQVVRGKTAALFSAATEVGGVIVASIYLPNGNPIGTEKFDYKLRWMERLAARAARPRLLVQHVGDRLDHRLDHADPQRNAPVTRQRVGDADRDKQMHDRIGDRLQRRDPQGK